MIINQNDPTTAIDTPLKRRIIANVVQNSAEDYKMAATNIEDAPCVFCGYNGRGYYQVGTHDVCCPWHRLGGSKERSDVFRTVVAALFKEFRRTIAQQPQGAIPPDTAPHAEDVVGKTVEE